MAERRVESFPPGVGERLGTYVYRLIDPRNGETFYVGKGKATACSRTCGARRASRGMTSTTR
jgi:hypothetical protein